MVSIIWKPTKKEFQKIVNEHTTLASILRWFGLHVGAGNYKTLKRRIEKESIDIGHIKLGTNSNKGRSFREMSRDDVVTKYLKKGSKVQSYKLKQKLLQHKLLDNKCSECGQEPEWNGKPLSLQLDHINGDSSDNRLENLRILCPCCHSQTETFSGKRKMIRNHCSVCYRQISKNSTKCRKCASKAQKTKIHWPNHNNLLAMVCEYGFKGTGRKLGVSDNAIRKRIRSSH